jgi:hypothetical protein
MRRARDRASTRLRREVAAAPSEAPENRGVAEPVTEPGASCGRRLDAAEAAGG